MQLLDYLYDNIEIKIPSYEFFLLDEIKTNVLDTDKELTAVIDAGIKPKTSDKYVNIFVNYMRKINSIL